MKEITNELEKTKKSFSLFSRLRKKSNLDSQVWDDFEEIMIQADVGVVTTQKIIQRLQKHVREKQLDTPESALDALKEHLKESLGKTEQELNTEGSPAVWIFVGGNGVGKTTSVGKIAHLLSKEGENIVLAAGDTFRAAASDQLGKWANKCDAEFISGADGADPSSVIFDATEHAYAANASLVLADTAGRLHTKSNLMHELEKIVRVAGKGKGTVTEILLVLDSTVGQNGLQQAKSFAESVDLTGIILTKLDGSSKGGIIFSIYEELEIPVKFIGIGEGLNDLVRFKPEEFVEMIFDFPVES